METITVVMLVKVKIKPTKFMLEIAKNLVPPAKSLPLSPAPAMDTQIATEMRHSLNSYASISFDVEATGKRQKLSAQCKSTRT
ncbi:MAG: hypothetical protein ABJX82_00020 [Paracoccaceae bacterium]